MRLADRVETPSHDAELELRDLNRALPTLTPRQREVLLLVSVRELSYKQAAAVIGCEVGTIKSTLSHARSRLVQITSGHVPRCSAADR